MKPRAAPLLLAAVALAGCAGSGGKPKVRVQAGPPLVPLSLVRAEIRAARASDAELFAIFPPLPGDRRCAIPLIEGLREATLAGTCRTRVTHTASHGRYTKAFVTFREKWGRHSSSWTLTVRLPAEKVVATKLHGEPSPQLRYAATDSAAREIQLTRDVPCPGSADRVGPQRLEQLQAVTAVKCGDGFRAYPGQGRWEVFVRWVAVSDVSGLQQYFEQPSEPNVPKNGICLTVLEGIVPVAFVDAKGGWVVPRTPVDGCGHPLGFRTYGHGSTYVRWHVVALRKVRRLPATAG
jgi:hypothetical protein